MYQCFSANHEGKARAVFGGRREHILLCFLEQFADWRRWRVVLLITLRNILPWVLTRMSRVAHLHNIEHRRRERY